MPEGIAAKEINAVRLELRRFQNHQSDAAVQFHCIAIETNLAAALEGQNDASFREILASNVEHLAEAIRTERLRKAGRVVDLGIGRLGAQLEPSTDVAVNGAPNLHNEFGASTNR
jgi:hypothetical protein